MSDPRNPRDGAGAGSVGGARGFFLVYRLHDGPWLPIDEGRPGMSRRQSESDLEDIELDADMTVTAMEHILRESPEGSAAYAEAKAALRELRGTKYAIVDDGSAPPDGA